MTTHDLPQLNYILKVPEQTLAPSCHLNISAGHEFVIVLAFKRLLAIFIPILNFPNRIKFSVELTAECDTGSNLEKMQRRASIPIPLVYSSAARRGCVT